jgi:hypothetical protein
MERLLVSFSGGRTSAYMAERIWSEWRETYDIVVVFANTGKEDEGTLRYVRDCGEAWGLPIVWVEAKHVNDKGRPLSAKGWRVEHRIVDFETASRKGQPFEEMISVLGIPSTNAPFCSDQLKRKSIESYLNSIGWTSGTFYKALGIRCDEIDRISPNAKAKNILYPLVSTWPTVKSMVMDWAKQQPHDLKLTHPDLGNCDACWKKDMKRLIRIARDTPDRLQWWVDMTDKYGHLNPRDSDLEPPFNFYRGNVSVAEIVKAAQDMELQLELFARPEKLDGCSESCEVNW